MADTVVKNKKNNIKNMVKNTNLIITIIIKLYFYIKKKIINNLLDKNLNI